MKEHNEGDHDHDDNHPDDHDHEDGEGHGDNHEEYQVALQEKVDKGYKNVIMLSLKVEIALNVNCCKDSVGSTSAGNYR